MKLSVYVPKDLEERLRAKAAEEGVSVPKYVQLVLREGLEAREETFSEAFAALAGSWEDDRSTATILEEIEAGRLSSERPELG